MWLKRSLAVLVLLASTAPLRAQQETPTGTPVPAGYPTISGSTTSSGPPASTSTTSKGLFGSMSTGGWLNKGKEFLSSVTANVGLLSSDNVDKDYIKRSYSRALDGLTNMEWSCVRGLLHEDKGGDRMMTWNGRVMDIIDMAELEVHNTKVTEDGFVTAEVLFKYPKIILTSDFQYNSTVAGVGYSKTGTVKIRIGPASVTVSVKMPNSKETIKAEPNKEKCMNTITPDKITSSTENFEVIDVVYPYTFKFKSFSRRYMFNMFNDMQNDILKTLKDYLEHHVALSVKDIAFSCLDAKAAEKWKPLKPDDYCKEPSPTTEKSG